MDFIMHELYERFVIISKEGWIKSLRRGPTGVGYTFERLIGKSEDALCLPDYNGIEIKTHRCSSKSFIGLFNCNPIGNNSYELKYIFDNFCYYNPRKKIKALNVSVYCGRIVDVGINYKFSLEINDVERRIYLVIFDRLGFFVEKKSYWTFDALEEKLYKKMRYLAYIQADNKYVNGDEFFLYRSISFFRIKSFSCFLNLIRSGKIRVTFKISSCCDSFSNCDIVSHGTSFNISGECLNLLYDSINIYT